MIIYEFYSGSRWSYEAQGKFSYKEFTDKIRELFPIESVGKHFGDVIYIHKKFGLRPMGDNGSFCNSLFKCSKSDAGSSIYSRVVIL